jgi:hypothetical protein
VLANLMYSEAAVSWSTTHGSSGHLWIGEPVATAGLILLIFSLAGSDWPTAAVGAIISVAAVVVRCPRLGSAAGAVVVPHAEPRAQSSYRMPNPLSPPSKESVREQTCRSVCLRAQRRPVPDGSRMVAASGR